MKKVNPEDVPRELYALVTFTHPRYPDEPRVFRGFFPDYKRVSTVTDLSDGFLFSDPESGARVKEKYSHLLGEFKIIKVLRD